MQIKNELPPNIEEIDKALPNRPRKGVLYAWNPYIFNPDNVDIPPWLIEHEKVHFRQQENKPEEWWSRYLVDPLFRFEQELEAHRKEYQVYCRCQSTDGLYHNRVQRRLYLKNICERLAGPLYGNLMSVKKVKEKITE